MGAPAGTNPRFPEEDYPTTTTPLHLGNAAMTVMTTDSRVCEPLGAFPALPLRRTAPCRFGNVCPAYRRDRLVRAATPSSHPSANTPDNMDPCSLRRNN